MAELQPLLEHFVAVYGHHAHDAIGRYNRGGEAEVSLADAPVEWIKARDAGTLAEAVRQKTILLPADMVVRRYSGAALAEELELSAPSVQLMMRQYRSLIPTKQAVIGVRFSRDDVLTHVVHILSRKPPLAASAR